MDVWGRVRAWARRDWLGEPRRGGLAFVAVLPVLAWRILVSEPESDPAVVFARGVDDGLLFLAAYLVAYVVITLVVFARADDGLVRRWAYREGRGSLLQRYVWGTAPGPGVSMSLGAMALFVAVYWLPGADSSLLAPPLRGALGATIVASAWFAVVLSFSVAYWADNLLEDEVALVFPGDPGPPGWTDYVYFAVGVSSTFGTTDVDVRSREMRRTVTAHAVLAFVFNTVIVAAVVGTLATLR